MPKYGYIRVSTFRRLTNTNSPEGQRDALVANGADASNIFTDTLTSSKQVFPELDRLMSKLRKGDVLMVATLDRIARTLADAATLVTTLREQGIWIHILNIGLMNNSSEGNLLYDMLLALAKYERDMITERTTVGKAQAREAGKRDGRPLKYSTEKLDHAMGLLDEGNSFTEVEKRTGISRSKLQRERRERKAEAILSSKDKTTAEKTEAPTKAPEREREAQPAGVLTSNAEADVVEKPEASTAVLERDCEVRAAMLSEKLSAKPFTVKCEEWTDAIRELEVLFTQFPDNKKIAMSLARGYISPPTPRHPRGQQEKNVSSLEAMLLRFPDSGFAECLSVALYQVFVTYKTLKERSDVIQRHVDLSNKYANNEKIATTLARKLSYFRVADSMKYRENAIHHLSALSSRFKENEEIYEYYESARRHLA